MSTDWQKILLAAVFADHLLYDQLSPYYQNCFYARYRIGTLAENDCWHYFFLF
ncbi:pilus assembly protein PilV [Salmonella enterica]|uniref:Pilus assembly protein PilV n=2 Tax=Salmonella enterica I TaxID=59201 RepID=A0A5Z8Z7Z9_SALDE|nr:pilus assembly protein PilV [Escherichia coli]EAB5853234.1 pilus assembly protein PilV [Salmonella enterica subsp. enterica serovar Infantis]EAM5794732.1 pilus assembly protein PilV [Salmonella enterica]EBF2878640.1 pilus assembly protein PilV [Salmonella enterica subsp. enterica serovar Newport]EBQ9956899.1 pilus assembly protein PilV [Salmonella enterica subsp. enterica serovar Java]EBT9820588.1 pilus assembly protein PilV [Salmonella enterica subsp. enterica]ECA9476320.1 pilus assembly 